MSVIPKIIYISSDDKTPPILDDLHLRYFNSDEIDWAMAKVEAPDLIIFDDKDQKLAAKLQEWEILGMRIHPLSIVSQHIIQKRQEQKQ